MGFYDNVILPHCIELSCGVRALIPARKQVCAGFARWQDRLNGLQQVVAGGCQLNRDMPSLLKRAGFTIDSLEQAYHPAMPRTHGYLYQGIATRP